MVTFCEQRYFGIGSSNETNFLSCTKTSKGEEQFSQLHVAVYHQRVIYTEFCTFIWFCTNNATRHWKPLGQEDNFLFQD